MTINVKRFFVAILPVSLIHSLCPVTFSEPLIPTEGMGKWKGDYRVWRNEDGVLIGGPSSRKTYLAMKAGQDNYSLSLEIKLSHKDGRINSGVQVRSSYDPKKHTMKGPQADIGMTYWGSVYGQDWKGGKKQSNNCVGIERKTDWNQLKVTVICDRYEVNLNETSCVDTHIKTKPAGDWIGIQHHGGEFEVSVRNMILRMPGTTQVNIRKTFPTKTSGILEKIRVNGAKQTKGTFLIQRN